MLNHCELTNETHLHSSKQLPLIHGVTGYIKKSITAKPPLEGTTSCVYQSMLAGFHTVGSTNSKPYTAV